MSELVESDRNALRELGLSENEVTAYLGLLSSGIVTAGMLARKTGLHRSRSYASLERLLEKGLTSTIVRNNRHYYQAVSPDSLLAILEEKRKKIALLVPVLSAIQTQEPMEAGMHDGMRAFRNLREQILSEMKPGDVMRVQGAPVAANERMDAFLLDFHKRREDKGCGLKILYNKDARTFGKKREKLKKSEVRYMREPTATASWIEIYRDSVFIVVFGSRMVTFVVKDQKVRDSFATYFDALWRSSER